MYIWNLCAGVALECQQSVMLYLSFKGDNVSHTHRCGVSSLRLAIFEPNNMRQWFQLYVDAAVMTTINFIVVEVFYEFKWPYL